MVDVTKPVYGDVWANTGEKLAPDSAKIATGWIQEMMPYQYENFLQNRADTAITYLLQKGVAEWSSDQEYIANKSVVTYGGQLYMATATTTNVLPTVTASWKKLSVSFGANGAIPVSFGGTGATTAVDARTNLGIGSAATANLPAGDGMLVKLTDNTLVARSVAGTAGYITVTNGDGVAGNLTINVGANVAKTDTDAAWTTTSSIRLPSGSTAQRGTGTPGRIRFNLETGIYEGYDNVGWNPIGGVGTLDVQNFQGDGVRTTFTLSSTPRAENNTQVYFNGVYQQKNTYNLVGNDLVFDEAPASDISIEVVNVSSVPIGTTTAAQTSIVDSGDYYSSSNVEGALQYVGETLSNAVLAFPDYAAASAAAATLPDGQVVDVEVEKKRYRVMDGSLVFVKNLDQFEKDVAAPNGSAKVGFKASGEGAVDTNLEAKGRESVSVAEFLGFDPTGVTDSSDAISNALLSLGDAGGSVTVPYYAKLLVDKDIVIPKNCHLDGPHNFVGSPKDNHDANYTSLGGAIILNPSATITLKGGADVRGVLIYRKGMVFPSADASEYAGKAITVDGDDAGAERCLVIGFGHSFYSSGFQRPRVDFFYHDCTNGIFVENCLDNPKIGICHSWPFGTIAHPNKPSNWADRLGIAYHFKNTADWLTLNACFSYGHLRGTKIENVNHYVLHCPQADGTRALAESIGIEIDGTAGGCEEGMIITPRVAAQTLAGIKIATLPGVSTAIIGGGLWDDGTHGIWLVSGDLHIADTSIRDTSNGITIDSPSSRVFRRGVRFKNVTQPFNVTALNTNIYGGDDDFVTLAAGNRLAGPNMGTKYVTAASPLNLPPSGNEFNVVGSTGFGTLNRGWKGRVVTLIFHDPVAVYSSTGSDSSMRLAGNATFNAVAGSSLVLHHNGEQWYQVGGCL